MKYGSVLWERRRWRWLTCRVPTILTSLRVTTWSDSAQCGSGSSAGNENQRVEVAWECAWKRPRGVNEGQAATRARRTMAHEGRANESDHNDSRYFGTHIALYTKKECPRAPRVCIGNTRVHQSASHNCTVFVRTSQHACPSSCSSPFPSTSGTRRLRNPIHSCPHFFPLGFEG
jgi:hypothetical protein